MAFGLIFACIGTAPAQQDHATPEEVIRRVRRAARDLARSGEAGLATYSRRERHLGLEGQLRHGRELRGRNGGGRRPPDPAELNGRPLAETLTFGPRPGERIAADLCAAGRRPHGGWVEYDFPRPGETQAERKVSYCLAARGTPYVVVAGVYDPTAKVEDLDKLAGGRP